MAYIQSVDDAERRRQMQEQAAAGGTSGLTTSVGGGQTSSVPSASSAGATSAPQTQGSRQVGTGYVNLQRYFDLNQPAANQMANNLTSGINQEGQAVKQGLGTLQNQTSTAIASATPSYSPGLTSDVSYSGPKSIYDYAPEKYNDLLGRSQKVEEKANALGTNSGREALLQEQYGGNANYTTGQQGLDAFLAGRAGAQQFSNTQQAYGNLANAFGAADENINKQVQGAQKAAENINKERAATPTRMANDVVKHGVDVPEQPTAVSSGRFGKSSDSSVQQKIVGPDWFQKLVHWFQTGK